MEEPDILRARFGDTQFFQDQFRGINHYDVDGIFEILEANKTKADHRYEAARQEFLSIYGKHKGSWISTGNLTDELVDVTKLHSIGQQYLAFMRIKPNGYRGERFVPYYMELHLHLLVGKVLVQYRKRTRTISRGSHLHIIPKSAVSIRCISQDEAAVFVFRLTIDKNRRRFNYT